VFEAVDGTPAFSCVGVVIVLASTWPVGFATGGIVGAAEYAMTAAPS
jgi:hypothetical protein